MPKPNTNTPENGSADCTGMKSSTSRVAFQMYLLTSSVTFGSSLLLNRSKNEDRPRCFSKGRFDRDSRVGPSVCRSVAALLPITPPLLGFRSPHAESARITHTTVPNRAKFRALICSPRLVASPWYPSVPAITRCFQTRCFAGRNATVASVHHSGAISGARPRRTCISKVEGRETTILNLDLPN